MGSRNTKDPAVKKNRTRRMTWFNLPYIKKVKAKVSHEFLKLIDKIFPASSRLLKVLNRNTIKVSYSCLPNMGSIIKQHYQAVIAVSPNSAHLTGDV